MLSATLASRSYKGRCVERRAMDGFFNAGLLCFAGSADSASEGAATTTFADYLQRPQSRLYMDALSDDVGGVSLVATTRSCAMQTEWIHPRLAMDVARALSSQFGVWVERWVIETLSPSCAVPAHPKYLLPGRLMNHQKVILDETQLHCSIVRWFREKYPGTVIIAGLGENQDTEEKRLDSHAKGYTKGQPDIMIPVKTPTRAGFAVELKHPGKATAVATEHQLQVLKSLKDQGWETMLSSSYDDVCAALTAHMAQRTYPCPCCGNEYTLASTVERHMKRKKDVDARSSGAEETTDI